MRKFVGSLALILIALVAFYVWSHMSSSVVTEDQPASCTLEVKVCPDGSSVERTGPTCEFAACPSTPVIVATSTDVTLGVGQKGRVGDLEISFNSFLQDSRCPIDVQCIQAGAVNINVTFTTGPHSETKNMPSDEVPQRFDRYQISSVNIVPARKSKVEIPANAYKITFHVSK